MSRRRRRAGQNRQLRLARDVQKAPLPVRLSLALQGRRDPLQDALPPHPLNRRGPDLENSCDLRVAEAAARPALARQQQDVRPPPPSSPRRRAESPSAVRARPSRAGTYPVNLPACRFHCLRIRNVPGARSADAGAARPVADARSPGSLVARCRCLTCFLCVRHTRSGSEGKPAGP